MVVPRKGNKHPKRYLLLSPDVRLWDRLIFIAAWNYERVEHDERLPALMCPSGRNCNSSRDIKIGLVLLEKNLAIKPDVSGMTSHENTGPATGKQTATLLKGLLRR